VVEADRSFLGARIPGAGQVDGQAFVERDSQFDLQAVGVVDRNELTLQGASLDIPPVLPQQVKRVDPGVDVIAGEVVAAVAELKAHTFAPGRNRDGGQEHDYGCDK